MENNRFSKYTRRTKSKDNTNESIGDYSWDSSESSINSGYGVNEWSQSKLMSLLNNGPYYNRTSGTCYNGLKNQTTSCDFSKTGLTNNAKKMIDNVIWNLGANSEVNNISLSPIDWYSVERGDITGKECSSGGYCNDNVERLLTWQGKIGLLYPSDYGYATNNRTCLTNTMNSTETWNASCFTNNWVYRTETIQWTITALASSNDAYGILRVYDNGSISFVGVVNALGVYPTLYLKIGMKVALGNGSLNSPYELIL